MHNFDRGLIKWLPFDALTGFKGAILELKNKRLKKEKPILSADQYDELNFKLKLILEDKLSCDIYYYKNGYIKYATGIILKIYYEKRMLKIAEKLVNIDDILDINIEKMHNEYEDFIY